MLFIAHNCYKRTQRLQNWMRLALEGTFQQVFTSKEPWAWTKCVASISGHDFATYQKTTSFLFEINRVVSFQQWPTINCRWEGGDIFVYFYSCMRYIFTLVCEFANSVNPCLCSLNSVKSDLKTNDVIKDAHLNLQDATIADYMKLFSCK